MTSSWSLSFVFPWRAANTFVLHTQTKETSAIYLWSINLLQPGECDKYLVCERDWPQAGQETKFFWRNKGLPTSNKHMQQRFHDSKMLNIAAWYRSRKSWVSIAAQSRMLTINYIHDSLKVIFFSLHIEISHYHRWAYDILSGIFCRVCLRLGLTSHSIFSVMFGDIISQLTHLLLMTEYLYLISSSLSNRKY